MVDMKNIGLRPAIKDDRDFIWDLHQATMGAYLREAFGWDEAKQREVFDSRSVPGIDRIVTQSEQPIGVIAVLKGPRADVLTRIAIVPELQNQGIGSYLIRMIQEQCAGDDRPLRLSVMKCNPAWKLYQRLGFRTIRESEQEYHMLWEPAGESGREK